MHNAAIAVSFIFIFAVVRPAHARTESLSGAISQNRTVISGTLNPASLSLNGQQLSAESASVKALLFNGSEVSLNEVNSLKTFYFTTELTEFTLAWKLEDSQIKTIIRVRDPAVIDLKTDGDELFFTFNENVKAARLDGQEINLSRNKVRIDGFKEWLKRPHALELTGDVGSSRIYDLNFSSLKDNLLKRAHVSLILTEPTLSLMHSAQSLGLNAGLVLDGKKYLDAGIYASEKKMEFDWGSDKNPIEQALVEIRLRYGYYIFDTNDNTFNVKRLILGIQGQIGNYRRISRYATNTDGYDTDHVDFMYLAGGPFFRWEPVQHKNWSVFFGVDFNPLKGLTNDYLHINTTPGLGVGFYFE